MNIGAGLRPGCRLTVPSAYRLGRQAPGRSAFTSRPALPAALQPGCIRLKKRKPCKAVVQASSASAAQQSPFQQERQQDALQSTLAGLPGSAVTVAALLLVGCTAAAGTLVGARAPATWRLVGKIAGGLVGAAVGGFAVKQLQEKRAQAAGIALHNLLVSKADPGSLTRQEVEEINTRFGIDLVTKRADDVATLYGQFLENAIPRGEQPLTGHEADAIRSFKEALGLSDEAAAQVHIDVGRRFVRSSFEAGSREANTLEKKTFQKLIFVSNLVFGDQKAAFLLPWRRVFKLTDSQLAVAKRDSAKALFKSFLDARGGFQADKAQLSELRQYQQNVRLSDEVAQDIVKDAARAQLEARLDAAVAVIKERTRARDYSGAISELEAILTFNRQLDSLAGDPEVVPGLGRTTVYGGPYDAASGEGKGRELRSLFRIFLEEKLRQNGKVDDQLEQDLGELQKTLALGPKEAQSVRDEVISTAYRRLLREEFQSGRLAKASSKAAVLQDLCERLKYDAEAAMEVHKGIYTERIEKFLEDEKLTEEEANELTKLRKLLCLPSAAVAEIDKATKGRIFAAVVQDALGAGIDGFTQEDRKAVRKGREAVRLDEKVAKDILKATARKAFLGFITRSRNTKNRLDGAKELKKLVFFSNIIVSPLLEDLRTKEEKEAIEAAERAAKEAAEAKAKAAREKEAAMKEFADTMAKAKAAADRGEDGEEAGLKAAAEGQGFAAAAEPKAAEAASPAEKEEAEEEKAEEEKEEDRPATLAKAQDAAAERATGEEVGSTGMVMKSQKEVTLAEDLELRDRTDIYRNFLLYCMSGDVVALPMGTTVVVERDSSEFARLSQLGDVLGLTQFDVAGVHSGLAEQSFRHQVQSVMADGILTTERSQQLTEMRQKMGLSEEAAKKIIKGVQNQRLIGSLQAAKSQGQLTLQRLLDMRESGVDIESFVSEDMRLQMFTKEVQERLSDGTGDFDPEALLKKLPTDLALPEKKVINTMKTLAKDRRRTTLVQAISMLRQKKLDDTVKSVNNLVACDKALPPEGPVSWEDKAELQDLFSVYVGREKNSSKQAAVAQTFGLSGSEADNLKQLVDSGNFKLEEEVESTSFF